MAARPQHRQGVHVCGFPACIIYLRNRTVTEWGSAREIKMSRVFFISIPLSGNWTKCLKVSDFIISLNWIEIFRKLRQQFRPFDRWIRSRWGHFMIISVKFHVKFQPFDCQGPGLVLRQKTAGAIFFFEICDELWSSQRWIGRQYRLKEPRWTRENFSSRKKKSAPNCRRLSRRRRFGWRRKTTHFTDNIPISMGNHQWGSERKNWQKKKRKFRE